MKIYVTCCHHLDTSEILFFFSHRTRNFNDVVNRYMIDLGMNPYYVSCLSIST